MQVAVRSMSFTTLYSSPAVLGCGVFWHSYYRLGVTHLEERQSFLSKRVWEWPSHHLKTDSGQQWRDKKILLSPEGGGALVLGACWRNTHLVRTYENIHFDWNHTRLPCELQYKQSCLCLPEASGCCVVGEPEIRECSTAPRLLASWLIPFNELVAI